MHLAGRHDLSCSYFGRYFGDSAITSQSLIFGVSSSVNRIGQTNTPKRLLVFSLSSGPSRRHQMHQVGGRQKGSLLKDWIEIHLPLAAPAGGTSYQQQRQYCQESAENSTLSPPFPLALTTSGRDLLGR